MLTALCGQIDGMQKEMSSTFAKNSAGIGELSERFRQHECDANKPLTCRLKYLIALGQNIELC